MRGANKPKPAVSQGCRSHPQSAQVVLSELLRKFDIRKLRISLKVVERNRSDDLRSPEKLDKLGLTTGLSLAFRHLDQTALEIAGAREPSTGSVRIHPGQGQPPVPSFRPQAKSSHQQLVLREPFACPITCRARRLPERSETSN